ncbi:glycoside hydrolase family 127 protein [Paenibacillus cellulositrophicus]|uniref:glycoside hydrolase family 127 protein n=1 Tax=Paenibacillus cellulositrophicus TaxID=562959 RepID=UPI00203DCAB1|nr:beta-L-arabinofuranosidase domain-containing protein [Paenibacillus cellulositrophicus]MCM2997981.1 glycoside hydrolase family 127 protein [Paenibacillus cellulositrophicus]
MSTKNAPTHPQPLDLKSVRITDSYWSNHVDLIKHTVIPYQWEALNDRVPDAEPSHAIRNFRIAAGLEEGSFAGFVFQDTDLYKWLEAVGYSLAQSPDSDLEKVADEAIELIGAAQQEDGYLNTYFTIDKLDQRWTNLMDCHEMYTAGHLIEAAVAYFYGTGKTKLLDIARKVADHIDDRFGPEEGKIRGYDGHQEIELALVKLYHATGEARYLNLAGFLIDERGQEPNFFAEEFERRGRISHWAPGVVQQGPVNLAYHQAHKPVREHEVATGHAVRAVYMYTAMADLALLKGDNALLEACRRLWNNIVQKQMYVTGSIGSTHHGEAFTFDYDLPNDTNYSETCASIGLIFFAQRLLQNEVKGEYADVMERALYNTVTAGIAGDGKHYFYVNPMEVWPAASEGNPGKRHIKPVRQKWYGCACCPPNVSRLLSSLGQYIYSASDEALFVHLYIGSQISHEAAGRSVQLDMESRLPWEGQVRLNVQEADGAGDFTIALRLPGWSAASAIRVNGQPAQYELRDGYAYIRRDWQAGDVVELELDMQPRRIYAHPNLRASSGKVALQRGPLVYCLEETDNGAPLASLSLPADAELQVVMDEWRGGVAIIEADGLRTGTPAEAPNDLYSTSRPPLEQQRLRAVPYTLWGNREPGEMTVWIRES